MENKYNQAYEQALDMLNEQQRKAVINFEGPLMVVAGPGTGKTQLLAIRIGYILQNTDAKAHNILALTYTEAGAIAMRQRLLQFIGPDAYKVNIYTFHGFCSSVIKDNAGDFGGYRNLQALSDLELDEVLRNIIDRFEPGHPLKRLSGNIYYERSKLKNLFNVLKQEGWSKEQLEAAIETDLADFIADEQNYYKRSGKNYKKGDLKQKDYDKLLEKFDALRAGIAEFDNYNKLLEEKERFDYNDMILWVIKAFKNNPDLLLDYQERYQYFLVDEYQDTNGSQNELLFLLASYWDAPNVFVVGDDDQSIYRFQGASMENLEDFRTKFDPKIIVLEDNYRSTSTILDASKKLIEHNQERLVNSAGLSKNLRRGRTDIHKEADVRILRFHNEVHEERYVVNQIEAAYAAGKDLSKIAVIYRKHKNVEQILKYLNNKRIPVQIRREVNVLETPDIKRIILLLDYFLKELDYLHAGEDLLFKILHFEYFKIPAIDIAKLSIYCSRRTEDEADDLKWRNVLNNEGILNSLGLEKPDKLYQVGQLIERMMNHLMDKTPQMFFERLFTELGILDTILKDSESTWRMQVINSFFNYIKEETTKDHHLTMQGIFDQIQQMLDAKIAIKLVKLNYSKSGVQFTTIHSSKGLEYDIVFIIKSDKNNWKPRSNTDSFHYPDSLTPSSKLVNQEDDRRLFYVAMTRARNELFICYSIENEAGKKLEPSSYVIELNDLINTHEFHHLSDTDISSYKLELMRFEQGKIELLDRNLINQQLQNLSLSVTGLNKYLNCPLSYYFDNILRVPSARNKYNGFGSAMHYALEYFFRKIQQNPSEQLPDKSILMDLFVDGMNRYRAHFTKREYDDLLLYGKENLSIYYDEDGKNWMMANNYHLELRIKDVEHAGVPINGMIDRVMVLPTGVMVFDYKTGRYRSEKIRRPKDEDDKGGDYWRQIVFYSLLIKAYPFGQWKFIKGLIPFLETKDDRFRQVEFEVNQEDQELVTEQLKSTYEGILQHNFEGCGEDDCRWCNFVKQDGDVLEEDSNEVSTT